MTVEGLLNRLTEYFSWLYYRHWERWELLTIAIVAVAGLLLVVRAKRKARNVRKRTRERSPIIGIKLAQHRGKH
jgi:hypothetical protein